MRFKDLKVGKSIEITVVREGYKLSLKSKIEVVSENYVGIRALEANGRRFMFRDNDEISIIYKNENRLWRWTDLKAQFASNESMAIHCFYGENEGKSYNRRDAYRVFLGERNTFYYTSTEFQRIIHVNKENLAQVNSAHMKKDVPCIIKNISEHGAAILTKEELKKSDVISFTIDTEMGKIVCIGTVIRCATEEEGVFNNFYGIRFTEVSSIISKYIFAVQRENLKKARK